MALTLVNDEGQTSAKGKRRTQLERWDRSDTNQELPYLKKDDMKVKFPEDCVFLAACTQGDKEEVKRLIAEGCDINTGNIDGFTALHQACIDDKLDMVQFLVEHGAYLDVADNEGWTPLHATSNCGYLDIAKYLLDHGANCLACNCDGDLPVDITDNDEIKELLENHMEKLGLDPDAARREEEELMLRDAEQWLEERSSPDTPDPKTGATALHVAAAKNYVKVIKKLIECNCNMDPVDFDGWTPLHAAARWGQQDACRLLAENMCNMEAKTNASSTVFDVAAPELLDLLQELKEKQVILRKENPVISHKIQAPLRRRSSVTRLSRDEKQNLVLKNMEEERAQLEAQLLKDETNKVREEVESDHSDTEIQNKINRQNEDVNQDKEKPNVNRLMNNVGMEDGPAEVARPAEPARKREPSPEGLVSDRAPKYSREEEKSPDRKDARDSSDSSRDSTRETSPQEVTMRESPAPVVKKDAIIKEPESVETKEPEKEVKEVPNVPISDQPVIECRKPPLISQKNERILPEKEKTEPPPSKQEVELSSLAARRRAREERIAARRLQAQQDNTEQAEPVELRRNLGFTPPHRDEETETQRKARARRARETRRSTQGVTMEDLEKAQETTGTNTTSGRRLRVEDKVRQDDKENKPDMTSQAWRRVDHRKDSDPVVSSSVLITATTTATTSTATTASTATSSTTSSATSSTAATTTTGTTTSGYRARLGRDNNTDSEKEELKTSAAIRARRRREERRSTGKVDLSEIMEAEKRERKTTEEEKSETDDSRTSDSSRKLGGSLGTDYSTHPLRERPASPYLRSSTSAQPDTKDYKKLYEDERLDNERLRLELSKTQQELAEQKSKLDELRKERRALDRKMSEKDEELKTMNSLKDEMRRVKEENATLIRVISKLSK